MGFIVAGTVIGVFVILITRAVNIAKKAKDDLGSYIAMGVIGIILFHVIENIGMTMGLLPITGVPLLFVSYGGSSLLTSFMLIGLLINVGMRKEWQLPMKNGYKYDNTDFSMQNLTKPNEKCYN